jgi:hypothetical protein
MLFHERADRLPRGPTLVEPWQGKRPIVLHSLADEHAGVRPFLGSVRVDTQRVIEQQLVLPDQKQEWRQSRKVGKLSPLPRSRRRQKNGASRLRVFTSFQAVRASSRAAGNGFSGASR